MMRCHSRWLYSCCALLASVCLCSCTGSGSEDEVQNIGVTPWHMWGNSLLVPVPFSLAILEVASAQILNVNYARPESFNFLFVAQLASIPEPVNPGQIQVDWDLIVGLGRTRSSLPSFERYIFTFPGPTNPTGQMKWSNETVTPERVDGTATSVSIVREIVAQDIVLNARLSFTGLGPFPVPAQVQLSAYFAPVTHIRPEWWEGIFRGGEDEGN